MSDVVGVLAGVSLLMALVLLVRNNRVFRYRTQVLAKVAEYGRRDIALGRDWVWRFDAYNSVGYYRMVYMFWRPLDSFYNDRRFLSPPEELVP